MGLEAVLTDLRGWREDAWKRYMEGPGGATEALRQGKFEGIDRAVKRVHQEIRNDPARVDILTSALERTERNLQLAIQGKPVRDLAENLAENAAALGDGQSGDHQS